MEKSVIFPIKKKPNSKSVNDFRPINITSCICRIFERLLRNAIQLFLCENASLNNSQQGFLKGRSTTTALLRYSNDLSNALNQGQCIDCAYFDFSKAFDSVRHDYLIYKLLRIGISGPLLKWIINYLQNRSQVVNVNGVISTERKVSSGVIQGSVLGPILFIIFVNDVDDHIGNCTILKYADDIRIYRCFKSDLSTQSLNATLFQNDINALTAWSQTWDLKFNLAKCCILHFGRANIKNSYKINDSPIDSRRQEKDLGVIFSNKFNFSEHMDVVIKKANKKLGIIAHIFKNKNSDAMIPLFKTFVRPILEYNSIIWSPYTKKYVNKIEKIQIKFCKLVSDFRDLSYQHKLKKAKLLSLRARRIQHQLITMFKMKNNLVDLCFEDFFQKNNYNKTRGNAFKLIIPKSKSKAHQGFFTNACVKHWNRLKSSEINVRTCRMFKKKILNYFERVKIW